MPVRNEVVSNDTPVSTGDTLTFEQAEALFAKGLMGTIEFRNWLDRTFHDFAAIRDPDIDSQIRKVAELHQKRQEAEAVLAG